MRAFTFMLVLSWAGVAAGGEGERAAQERSRQIYVEAKKLYDVGEYAAAEVRFKQAYLVYDHPAFLLNMAQCERLLGHHAEAAKLYRAYLRGAPAAANRAEVEALLAKSEAEAAVGSTAAPPRAALADDLHAPDFEAAGARTGTATEPLRVEPPLATAEVATPAPAARQPLYRKWWLWTIVGGATVALAVGLGVGLGSAPTNPTAVTGLGTFRPF